MRRILVFLATMVMGVLLASGVALAAVVSEVEPNDSIPDGAQEIAAASFDLTASPDIYDSTIVPHATVNGTGDDTYDYYSFTVPAGDPVRVVLDIDNTTPDPLVDGDPYYDPVIELYDSSGQFINGSDDNSRDPGSTEDTDPRGFDSFIATTLDPGTYYVKVGRYPDDPVPAGATYQLHVSVGNPPAVDDTTPPRVEAVSPADLATHVDTTANVTATFSEEVQGVTNSTFTLERVVVNKKGVEQLRKIRAQVTTGIVGPDPSFLSTDATLDPNKPLPSGTYQVTITNNVTDLAGNPLDPWTSRFTVGSPPV